MNLALPEALEIHQQAKLMLSLASGDLRSSADSPERSHCCLEQRWLAIMYFFLKADELS